MHTKASQYSILVRVRVYSFLLTKFPGAGNYTARNSRFTCERCRTGRPQKNADALVDSADHPVVNITLPSGRVKLLTANDLLDPATWHRLGSMSCNARVRHGSWVRLVSRSNVVGGNVCFILFTDCNFAIFAEFSIARFGLTSPSLSCSRCALPQRINWLRDFAKHTHA